MPGTTQTSLLPLSTLLLLAQVVMVVVSSDRGRNISLWSMMVASRKLKCKAKEVMLLASSLLSKYRQYLVVRPSTPWTLDSPYNRRAKGWKLDIRWLQGCMVIL